MLTVGALLQYGKYQVDDVLAVKGSSVTYRAKQCELDQSVVIKTVVAEYLAIKVGIGRFLGEARRLSELQHPHIVRVGDCFVEQGRLFLVTDFLSGQSLARKIAQGPVPVADALRYVHQIGQAIALMHQQGLLHRDIKPSNIMLSEDRHSATLSDFNIARSLLAAPIGQSVGRSTDQMTDSAPNQAQNPSNSLGNEFIAPELILSPHLWTVAADIYGLAATLYALVTGKAPAAASQQSARSWREAIKAQISEHRPELAEAISTGMAMEMGDRPSNVSEWLALLPANDPLSASNGHASLERIDSASAGLVLEDLVQINSTPDLSPKDLTAQNPTLTDVNELDPTLAVLEHPQPVTTQPVPTQSVPTQSASSQKTRLADRTDQQRRSSRGARRSSLAGNSRSKRFPRKALLLSAIASGVGGVAFGFFMKTQIFSALVLPSSLSTLTPPETIQETFPPKAGSQGYGGQSEPSLEPPLNDPDPSGTTQSEPFPSYPSPEAAVDPAPIDAARTNSSPDSLDAAPDAVRKPTVASPSESSTGASDRDMPIAPETNSINPSFDAPPSANLEPLPVPSEAETLPGEESSVLSPSFAEPTLP